MKKKQLEIPKFASEREEAEFWSTHDTTDYWQDAEEAPSGEFELEPALREQILQRAREKQLISLRLERRQIVQAKQIALRKAVPYQVLIRMWIEEGIQNELRGFTIAQAPYQTQVGTTIKFGSGHLDAWKLPDTDFSVDSSSKTSERIFERPALT
jgi:predicted DNA binding CopG/RHH family protein